VSTHRIPLTIDLLVCWILLLPSAFPSQEPSQPGRLFVSSRPMGASITIDGKHMNQPTDATFVASSGTHKVSVTGGPGRLNCQDTEIQVSSGQQTTVYCSDKGWQQPPKSPGD
jgi:hypothetical protein